MYNLVYDWIMNRQKPLKGIDGGFVTEFQALIQTLFKHKAKLYIGRS